MAHDDDSKRSEPSFGQVSDEARDIDFDELYAEIDRSVADVFATPVSTTPVEEESWVDELSSIPEIGEEEGSLLPEPEPLPAQPTFDFGVAEHDAEPVAAQPYFDSETQPDNGEEPMSRGVLMAGGALAALAILLGAVGLFAGLGASGRIEALQQQVESLQAKISTLQVSGDPRVGQLQAEQGGMTSRLDEMSARLDALATPGDEKQLGELSRRLDALEHRASKSTVSAQSSATASNPVATKTVATKTAATPRGDWTVILLSSQLRTQADSERSRIQKLGYSTDVIRTEVDGKPWYRVRVVGYQSHEAAKAAIPTIERKTGIKGVWAAHR